MGSVIKAPVKTRDVRPVYPPIAMTARVSGMVILEARVGSDGSVEDARVIRSVPLLDQAALDAVMQWRFRPTLLNGLPVPVIMTLTVNFVLEPSAQAIEGVPETRQMPVLIKEVRPVYPEDALRAGVEGTVEVEVTIGTDGKVVDPRVIRSIPMLNEAALTAVRQWEFHPLAQAVATTIELTFSTKRTKR